MLSVILTQRNSKILDLSFGHSVSSSNKYSFYCFTLSKFALLCFKEKVTVAKLFLTFYYSDDGHCSFLWEHKHIT